MLAIAMALTLVPVSYVGAEDVDLADVALSATATANADHPEWGIEATNLNDGHEPTSSSSAGGSWHDYGIESEDGTSWVQYDWTEDVVISSMSIYWMVDGTWENRIPQSAHVQYKDADGQWQTAGEYDSAIMTTQVPDVYNDFEFDSTVTTKSLRMTMVRNTVDNFCSIHRWQVWGSVASTEDPQDPAEPTLLGARSRGSARAF